MQSASGFFHGLVRPLWVAGREEPRGSLAPYQYCNSRSVAHPIAVGLAVQNRN